MPAEAAHPEEAVIDAACGALLGVLIGDCVGAPFEGGPAGSPARATTDVERVLATPPLRYTDDTELTIALAEHLLEHGEIVPDRLAELLAERVDPGRGYGAGMLKLVALWRSGVPIDEAATGVFPGGSMGNGAAMRTAPLALWWATDPDRLTEQAARAAVLTHAHPVGRDAAVLQARAVALACTRRRFGAEELAALGELDLAVGLRERLERAAGFVPADPQTGQEPQEGAAGVPATTLLAVGATLGTDVLAHHSVPTALWVAAVARNVPEAVTLAVALGGDVDTIAAMAAAVRGAVTGAAAIPADWREACEAAGRVTGLATRLTHARAGEQDRT